MYFKHLVFVITVLSFVYSAPNCGENEVYTNCMSPCKLQQCDHLKKIPDCDPNIKCQPGCECVQNFLRNSDNVCISSEICEEYDSEFDPETDIDVILNESDDDEATNEDLVFDNTVVENTDHGTEDDDQDVNGIEDFLSFEEQIKNGDWVIEQTEHNDANQEPNTDQQKLDDKKSEMNTERSTGKQTVQAPENEVEPTTATTITSNINQSKISATELNNFAYEVITTEISSVDLDLPSDTEKKLKPKEIESNRTEPNQINVEDKIGNTKFDQNVDETLETSTMLEKNELPIKRPVTEAYAEDKKDTNQKREPPRPEHDNQPNKTRPEHNNDKSRESTNMPENNAWLNRRPGTELNPEDREDTNQWPEPPRPWHREQPYTTSRPEQSTKPWYPYIPKRKWDGSKHHKRPISRKSPVTIIYPYPIFIEKSNERHTYPFTRPKYEHGNERKHERNLDHKHDRDREHNREHGHEHECNHKHGHDRDRGHERNHEHGYNSKHGHEHERNRQHEHDRKRGHEYERNREPERRREDKYERNHEPKRRRENEYDRNRETERRRENEYERNREPERRRENEYERNHEPERRREHKYGHDRPSHRRPRTWCRRHPGDKRRPCPRYNRPKHDSHKNYINKEHNSNNYQSYKRPKRMCMSQLHGVPMICYVRKDSRRN